MTLDTPGEGSLLTVDRLEERDDAVVVHLGAELGRHGPAYFASVEPAPEIRGYPFPQE